MTKASDFSAEGLESLRQMRKHLKALPEVAEWATVAKLLELRQVGILQGVMMNPLSGVDAALRQEYEKGRYASLDDVLNLGALFLEGLEEEIRRQESIEAARMRREREVKEPANADDKLAMGEGSVESGGRFRRSP